MTPSRTLKALSLSWLFLGLVSVAALVLLIPTIPKVEWNDVSPVATSTVQEVSGSAIYNGLPVGDAELLKTLFIDYKLVEEVFLKAYKTGRLPTGPRVYNKNWSTFVQVVGIPGSVEQMDGTAEPECGYYGGHCELIVSKAFEGESYKVFSDEQTAFLGLRPRHFVDESRVILEGVFGDGPHGIQAYHVFDVVSATTTHTVSLSTTYDEGIHYVISTHPGTPPSDALVVAIHAEADSKDAESVSFERAPRVRYRVAIEPIASTGGGRGESVIIERVVSQAEWEKIQSPVVDVDSYAKNNSELRLSFAGKEYLFDLTDNQIRLKR